MHAQWNRDWASFGENVGGGLKDTFSPSQLLHWRWVSISMWCFGRAHPRLLAQRNYV